MFYCGLCVALDATADATSTCTSNADCKGPANYCMNGAGKKPPFYCHAPNPFVDLTSIDDFVGKDGTASPYGVQGTYNGRPNAIGVTRCTSGGELFSKQAFRGNITITFDFATFMGGYLGYSSTPNNTGPPVTKETWPYATEDYPDPARIRFIADGEWRTYRDVYPCPYDSTGGCHIMLEDFSKSNHTGHACGVPHLANLRLS